MKIEIDIRPMRSGKTTDLIEMFIKNFRDNMNSNIDVEKDTFFVVPQQFWAKEITDKVITLVESRYGSNFRLGIQDYCKKYIQTIEQFSQMEPHWGKKPKEFNDILIDEYLGYDWKHFKMIYNRIETLPNCNIFIKTTPCEIYSKKYVDLAKKVYYTDQSLREFIRPEVMRDIDRFRYNLIIHPAAKIIEGNLVHYQKTMPQERFETEFLGKWIE